MNKQCDDVKGVAFSDEPTENLQLNQLLQVMSSFFKRFTLLCIRHCLPGDDHRLEFIFLYF